MLKSFHATPLFGVLKKGWTYQRCEVLLLNLQKQITTCSHLSLPTKKDTSVPLPKSYDPKFVEAGWYSWWEESGFFSPEFHTKLGRGDTVEPFIVCLPPPNVTGNLHLGHTLTVAIQDSLCRWHRMQGQQTLWIPGSDHAGIATQIVVEKMLWQKGNITRHQLGRKKFVEAVWKWKKDCGHEIDLQLKRLGASLDWSRPNFTMNEEFSRAVQEAFITLHDDGTIYRGNKLVNWSCTLRSTISDIEVDKHPIEGITAFQVPGYEEPIEFGQLTFFAYPVDGSGDEITVATTRVETMLGDTAVAVHPEDKRYKHLIGQNVQHPFIDRLLPIIASDTVDQEFGTGAVKITPGHDFNDYELGEKHNVGSVTILDETGLINCPNQQFNGLKRFHARDKIISALKELGLYRGQNEHTMVVPLCSRSKDIVEPMLREQWFVKCDDLAREAVQAVETGKLVIHPATHQKTWSHWLNNIRDWCISRQLWWGHRIPAYHVRVLREHPLSDEVNNSNIWVSGHSRDEAMKKASEKLQIDQNCLELTQDEDVLDTWFSSALFPFAVHGWPLQTENLNHYYPSTLLETGHDILFFWVARMVMMGQKLTGMLPFKEVYLHSMVRDAHGRKMSKSLGNVIDPVDVIQGISLEGLHARLEDSFLDSKERETSRKGQAADYPRGIPECGTDALRFALCTYKAQVEDINLDVNKVQTYRFFCNKIWNAALFLINALPSDFQPLPVDEVFRDSAIMDKWILSRLSHVSQLVNDGFHSYDFPSVTSAIHKFWIHNLCDVYLESVKPIIQNGSKEATTCQNVLLVSIEAGLRLLSPFMPFLTEELYQRFPRRHDDSIPSICISSYPDVKEFPMYDPKLEQHISICLDVVNKIRSIQKEFGISKAMCHILCNNEELEPIISELCSTMMFLSKCGNLNLTTKEPSGCLATSLEEGCTLLVETGGLDMSHIKSRIEKKLSKAEASWRKLEQQMSIADYEEKVPQHIREKHLKQIQIVKQDMERLHISLDALRHVR